MRKVRILLADDNQLFREGLESILNSQPDFEVVGVAGDGLEAVVKARKYKPDLILMDIGMPACDGVEATRLVKHESEDTMIVMLTVHSNEEKLFEAIQSGAQGYLLKNIVKQELLARLRGAVRGEVVIAPGLGGRMLEEFRRMRTLVPDSIEDD
jgi:two-component system nitrate/nitrite response regulator NarL